MHVPQSIAVSLAAPVAVAAALFALPASAQETPSNGGIPIYDITPQAVPTPVPVPVFTPTPRATATPTPRAVPTPRATPVSRPTLGPRATPTATPTPRTTPTAAVPVAAPSAEPSSSPVVTAVPVPAATPDAAVSPVVQAAPAPAPADAEGATPWWLWFLAGIVVAVLGTLLLGRLRRGQGGVEDNAPIAPEPVRPVVPVAPVPAPAVPAPVVPPVPAPVPDTPPAAPVSVPYAPLPFLQFQLAPLRVGTQGDSALLDFDLTIGNPTSHAVDEVRISTLLLTANARQDEQLATFFANAEPRGLDPFALPAGQRRHLEATMALPRDAVNVVTANDRPFFVPLMAIDARYRWADGRESRTTAAFVVGPQAPGGKLAPIFLDRGDRMIDRLEARLHGEVRRT